MINSSIGFYFRPVNTSKDWIQIRAARHRKIDTFDFMLYEYKINDRIYHSPTDTFILDFNAFRLWSKLSDS